MAPMNTRPDAVITGPPMFGIPSSSQSGNGARSRVVPSGTSHRRLRDFRSIATSAPQGGRLHGAPSGESIGSICTAYGVFVLGDHEFPLRHPRIGVARADMSRMVSRRCSVHDEEPRDSSIAALPQFIAPMNDGS